jgi:hypothetical protein
VFVLRNAVSKLDNLESVHFLIEITGRPTYLDYPPTLALKYVEGDISIPDRMQALVRISSFGTTTEVLIKEIDGQQYITNPLNQNWESVSEENRWYFDPSYFFDQEQGLAALIESSGWELIPDPASKKDVQFKTSLEGEKLSRLTSGMIYEGRVTIHIWLDREHLTLEHIQIIEVESDVENPTMWDIYLTKTDPNLKIDKPEL